jgi:PQQ-like domain
MRQGRVFSLMAVALAIAACGVLSGNVAAHTGGSQAYHAEYVALISARTGKVRRFLDLPDSAAVSDGRDGWIIANQDGVTRLRHGGTADTSWRMRPALDISTDALARLGTRLYVEGREDPPRRTSRSRVEAYDTRTGRRLWTSPRIGPGAHAFAVSPTRVYVGGEFKEIGSIPRRSLATFDARAGHLLGWQAPKVGGDVEALAVSGSRLYIGGHFDFVGGRPRQNLAAVDVRTGALLPWTTSNADPDETWNIFIVRGQAITYGKRSFGAADTRTGRPLSWPSRMSGDAGTFAADGPLLYLGGGFPFIIKSVDAHARNNLAAFNLLTGRFTNWGPILPPYVDVGDIAPSGDAVLVTGVFSNSLG